MPARKTPTPTKYLWDSLAIGELHFVFRGDLLRIRQAWNSYRYRHPECRAWVFEIYQLSFGVEFRRVR
jgi:hypothetical protein